MTSALHAQKMFRAMGTVNTITVFDGKENALEAAEERVKKLEAKFSPLSPDSEISKINESAGERMVTVTRDTFRLIKHAVTCSEITEGSFDITSGHLSGLWKEAVKTGVLPDKAAIEKAKALTGYRNIFLDHEVQGVMLKHKGMKLDPRAIAKGYAADEVRETLRSFGVKNAVINIGGTVINMGEKRKVGIQKPFSKEGIPFAYIKKAAKDKAVVSSGLYEQFRVIDGRTVHHIVDARTGYPSGSGLIGVTLVGDKAEELDALATAAFVLGIGKSLEMLKTLNIEALYITDKYELCVTEKLKNDLKMIKE